MMADRYKLCTCKGNMLSSSIHEQTRDDGTNRETTGEGPGLRKYPGKKNVGAKRDENRRLDELRVEVGVKEMLTRNWRGVGG